LVTHAANVNSGGIRSWIATGRTGLSLLSNKHLDGCQEFSSFLPLQSIKIGKMLIA